LWNEQDPRTGLPYPKPSKLDRHCGDIVANQNALLLGCQTKNGLVVEPIKRGFLGRPEVDG
jgi:hypothetical protein